MSTLFIIGNGFDRAHKLKTSYWDFRIYLEKYAPHFLIALENMYSFSPHVKLDRRSKRNNLIEKHHDEMLDKLLWKNFEHSLGEANESEMLDLSTSIIEDLHLDGGPIGIKDTMEVYWEKQYKFILQLNYYVYKWIRQVRLSKTVSLKSSFINNSTDYFFTFNFTSVLERIYGITNSRILHIHGGLPPYCNIPPILGHGNTQKIENYDARKRLASNQLDEGRESIYDAISKYYKRTLKDTYKCMAVQNNFFDNLSNVDTVEIIGHSFGNVDLPYFNRIKHHVQKNTTWKFYYHSTDDYAKAEEAIMELGLKSNQYKLIHSSLFWD